jgi:hypothetical protein
MESARQSESAPAPFKPSLLGSTRDAAPATAQVWAREGGKVKQFFSYYLSFALPAFPSGTVVRAFVSPDARQRLQAQMPRAKETRF